MAACIINCCLSSKNLDEYFVRISRGGLLNKSREGHGIASDILPISEMRTKKVDEIYKKNKKYLSVHFYSFFCY
jgi:hypothetical protein